MSQENAEYRAIKDLGDQLRLGCRAAGSTLCQKLFEGNLITEDLRQLCFKKIEERESFANRATELLQDRVKYDRKAYYAITSIMKDTHGVSYIGEAMEDKAREIIQTQNTAEQRAKDWLNGDKYKYVPLGSLIGDTAVQGAEPEKTGSHSNGSNGSLIASLPQSSPVLGERPNENNTMLLGKKEPKIKSIDEETKSPTKVFDKQLGFQNTARCGNCKNLCSEMDRLSKVNDQLKKEMQRLESENESLKKQLGHKQPFSDCIATNIPVEEKDYRVMFALDSIDDSLTVSSAASTSS